MIREGDPTHTHRLLLALSRNAAISALNFYIADLFSARFSASAGTKLASIRRFDGMISDSPAPLP